MARPTADSRAEQAREEAKARTAQLLREIRRIEIQTSRLVNQHLAGSYQSVFKGQGLSFREVRSYQPGDDIRWIDWNVSARMSEPYVKVFVEEREMTVMLVVDLSQSEQWGTRRAARSGVTAASVATMARSTSTIRAMCAASRVGASKPWLSARSTLDHHTLRIAPPSPSRTAQRAAAGRGRQVAQAPESKSVRTRSGIRAVKCVATAPPNE